MPMQSVNGVRACVCGGRSFERYKDENGVMSAAAEFYQLREAGSTEQPESRPFELRLKDVKTIEWREVDPAGRGITQWGAFPGGTVFCPTCLPIYRVFDPVTGKEADL